jgi:heterodisulfide reductase subunit C
MTVVNPNLLKEIKKYSTKDFNVEACFNCGNCTAICPRSDEEFSFPRSLIRYAQVGLKDKILGSELMWLCAYCNDCSDTCPRDANPGEFVMATRRWAMGQYEVTGISRLFYTTPWAGIVAMGLIFLFSIFLFGIFSTPADIPVGRPIRLFDLVKKEVVEVAGITLAGGVITIIGLSIFNMYRLISKEYNSNLFEGFASAYETREKDKKLNTSYHLLFSPFIMFKQAIIVAFKEIFGQKIQWECQSSIAPPKQFRPLRSRWFMHILILWGFFGLGLATILNMLFKPDSNALVSITYPVRLLGIISGIVLMIGVGIAFWNRLSKNTKYSSYNLVTDWILLINLFLVGLTGFLITITYYIPSIPSTWAYWFFIAHMIVIIELILIAPFGKFAHVWYRSFALWIHYGLKSRKNKLLKAEKRAKEKTAKST